MRILILYLLALCYTFGNAQTGNSDAVLLSQFTPAAIEIDGESDVVWQEAKKYSIEKAVTADLSKPAIDCNTSGTVSSLWDGTSLYLLIEVQDRNISTSTPKFTDQDGVGIYIDLFNDKFPKYMEDDGLLFVNAKGDRQTQGTDVARFGASAVKSTYDANKKQTGYTVELVFHLGGIRIDNGSKMGLEIGINNTDSGSVALKHKIFWSSTANNGLHDNSRWGTVILSGYDEKSAKKVNNFNLNANIQRADNLNIGIWQNEGTLQQALRTAKDALLKEDQSMIDQANADLEKAIRGLRRKGSYPDPYDLPEIEALPDPFTFQNGKKVKKTSDWERRADEIKNLAQYYEYGKLPDSPVNVTATLNDKKLTVSVTDQEKTVSFEAQLSIPSTAQSKGRKSFPVIVSIDFAIREADSVYLNAGYAVLNFRYTSVSSDNAEHAGPFYELYPYDIKTGNDAGTLLAWAWGAMRCVDALEYLAKHNPALGQTLDLNKIVVTGFSRCGKAALAAGLFDKRFSVVNPGASGCGGAAVFRYVSFGGPPKRNAPYGNEYAWGRSPGCEVMGDKIRHQGHNSNAMLARFLDPDRIYNTNTFGYGERLPYDHHEIIAAIAPRAVLITTANDDYSNNAEGDAIGLEGAKPVYKFLGIPEKLGFNLRTTGEVNPWGYGGGHWVSIQQRRNLIHFSNLIFYKTPLPKNIESELYSNPYLPTFNKYYGGLKQMMPWLH